MPTSFRQIIDKAVKDKRFLVVPGAHDALSALDVGYPNHFAFVHFPEGAICTKAH